MRRGLIALFLLIAIQGCDIAQERVYILTESTRQDVLFDTKPNQATLVEALQLFAKTHSTRCRQHVKRWDEWSCNGPNGTRITFQKDRRKNRFVAEFTLVIRSDNSANEFHEYVEEFCEYMEARFDNAVLHIAR